MTNALYPAPTWEGFSRHDFTVDGRAAILIQPRIALPGKPWIWRIEFFAAFAWVDIALLDAGYHLAYVNVQDMYGAPKALDQMDALYEAAVDRYGLAFRPVLEGFSRGGLFALNWARRWPARIGCLYLDAPVCDIHSWPGGKERGSTSRDDWEKLQIAYGQSEGELAQLVGPLDDLARLVDAGIKIVVVYGALDTDLPPAENALELAKRYRALGGDLWLLDKPEIGHHPHSLENPEPIVQQIRAAIE